MRLPMPLYGTLVVVLLLVLLVTAVGAEGLFEQTLAVQMPRGDYGYRGSMGDFAQLKDGAILMSYTQTDIMVIKSIDGGRTWGPAEVLVKRPAPPAKGNIAHPSFLRLPSGDLMMTFIYNTYPTTPYYGHNYYRLSADEGATWSEQYCFTPYPGYLPMHNDRLQVLSTGRILGIAEYKAHLPSSDDHSGYAGISFFSDDGGYSWQPSKNTVDMFRDGQNIEVQEADAVELRDGRVMMFARTYSGYAAVAYSSDRGETWGSGELRKDIVMPYAGMPTVRRLPKTGDLLFIWIGGRSEDREKPDIVRRSKLVAAISKDEGQTLINQRPIADDPEDDFGYQCVEFLQDGTILIGYHCRDGLRVARVQTEWFYGQ